MNIEERNEAIALFDGKIKDEDSPWWRGFDLMTHDVVCSHEEQLKYHSSWDWLMPACKKMDEAIDALWDNELINEYPIDYLLLEDELLEFNIDGVFFNLSNLCDWYSDYKNSCGQL
jgi:hypothetical protein